MKLCAIILNYFGHEETIACINRLTDQLPAKIVVLENSGSEDEKHILTSAFIETSIVEVISSKKKSWICRRCKLCSQANDVPGI